MSNPKIIQMLQTMDRIEIREMNQFLRSPYFNQREDVIRLFEELTRTKTFEKEALFAAVYPDRSYRDRDFHLVVSYLLKLIEEFFAVHDFRSQSLKVQQSLLQSYRRRHLTTHFRHTARRLQKELDRQPLRDTYYYAHLRDLTWEQYQEEVATSPSGQLPWDQLMDSTDIAYFAQKLRQACLLSAQQAVYSAEYDVHESLQAIFFPYIQRQNLLQYPVIALYYYGYWVLYEPEQTDYFQSFKSLLFEHSDQFSHQEIRELYLIAINFCVKKVNRGERAYFQEMHALYQKGLELEILLENQQLSRFTYHNIVASALQIKAYDWAFTFIHDYQQYLEPSYRESSFRYNLARLHFEQQGYDKALSLLHGATFQDILLHLAAKTITLKIYYALHEFNLLDSHLHAMNRFIRRNKVLGYHRKNYLNILRFTKKLIALNPYDKSAVAQLHSAIQSEPILTEKNWLLQQLPGS
jgi:hypothetical protein